MSHFMKNIAIFALLITVAILLLVLAFNIGRGMRGIADGQGQHQTKTSPETESNEEIKIEAKTSVSILKVCLGKRGVSEDLTTWYEEDRFAEFIKSCQEKGIREIQYKLMPDSIERVEKRWSDALKNANMKSYVEAD